MTIIEQMAAGLAPAFVPLSVDQYHRMISGGILFEGDAIELIDGILVRKDRADLGGSPLSHAPRHAYSIKRIQRAFHKVEESGFHQRSQLPVTLGGSQEPEPDLTVTRGREEDFLSHHPTDADIAAVMEVSASSLNFDRTTKQRLYASASIPVYWVVNLLDNQIEVYEAPVPEEGKYARRTDYRAGQTVSLELPPGLVVEVAVAEVLPA